MGVHCPECTREARQSAPRTRSRLLATLRAPGDRPIATYILMATSVLIFVGMYLTGGSFGAIGSAVVFVPDPFYIVFQPWRLVTSMFAHAGIFHLLFNMYALYLFGGQLEYLLGRVRFLLLYFLSGIGGSAAVVALAPDSIVLGASGAIFGLFSAYFVISRRLGANATQLLVVIALNFVIGFLPGFNISWQAHLGGAIVGALVALVLVSTRNRAQRKVQAAGLAGIALVVVVMLLSRLLISY